METAYIGMGANVPSAAGTPEQTLAAALARIATLGRVTRRSRLYSTAPVGYADQPRFINAVIALETTLSPRHLLNDLLRIEHEFGRDRASGPRNGPRTLDLDLLLYGDQVIHEAGLEIPHPRLPERAFVLVPLVEVASNALDAARQLTAAQLLDKLHNRFPTERDAIFPISSAVWLAAPRSGAPLAGASESDPHH